MSKKRRGKDEGGLYQRNDGYWVGNISLGYDSEGKRIRKVIYGKTKKEAKEKMHQLQQDHANGLPVKTEKITVDQHFQDWLRVKKGEVSKKSYDSYVGIYNNHIKKELGHLQLKNLDYRRINALYEKLDEKGLSKRTVAYVCMVLRSGLEDANRKGLVSNNQAKLAASRTQGKTEARFLNQEEMRRFVYACQDERLGSAFILALHTGLRPGEWLGLPWDAIDWKKKTLTVKQAMHADENGYPFIGKVKTTAGHRTITLPDTAINALKAQWKQQSEEIMAAKEGKWDNSDNLVFTNKQGGYLRINNVRRRDFKHVTDKAELENVNLHTLRHTHASALIYQGADIKTVSRRLGHEDVGFTLQVYGHLLPGQDEKAAQLMDEFANSME